MFWRPLLAAVALLVSLGIYARFHTLSFPEHSITFAVNRGEAAARAEAFIREASAVALAGYTAATVWDTDEPQKTYLEKELGVARTAELADSVALWGFRTRYFRPLQKEELEAFVQPNGQVAGYRHVVDETAPGARLTREEAMVVAESARRDVARLAGDWRLVEGESIERPARLDWRFTWERVDDGARVGSPPLPADAGIRWSAVVQGADLGAFNLFLKVPEQWVREYRGVRSANELALAVDSALLFLPLSLAAAYLAIRLFARHALRLRTIAVMAVLAAVITSLEALNSLPLAIAAYDTLTSWEAFLAQHAIVALVTGIPQALGILIFAVAGEALYRRQFPHHLTLGSALTWRGMMTRPGATALALGVVFAAVAIAYQVSYYVFGTRIGFWVPAETSYDALYSVVAPWFEVPAIGYLAASFEESAFRLFAIPLLTIVFVRVLGGRPRYALVGALVVSAVSWAFLHASYPQDPFYARGVELTIAGVFWGWVMVRYGILASMTAHYTFNAFAGAVAVQQASSPTSTALAYAFTLLPLGVAGVAAARAWRGGAFAPHEPLLNGAVQPVEAARAAPPAERGVWTYAGLSARRRTTVLIVGIAALLLMLAVPGTQRRWVSFDYHGAEERARAVLIASGVDLGGYQASARMEAHSEGLAASYLREAADSDAEGEIYDTFIPKATWSVRYARPLERDEYRVVLLPDAEPADRPFSTTFDLAETTPGARLNSDDARRAAEVYLAQQPGWSSGGLTLVDQSQTERANRIDHRFVFERQDVRYADATLRADLQVVGDRVSGYSPYVKIPEQWERDHSAVGLKQIAIMLIVVLYALGLVALDGTAFLRMTRTGVLPVHLPMVVVVGFLLSGLLEEANNLPTLYAGYQTSTPVETYLAGLAIQKLVAILTTSLLAGYVCADLVVGLWRIRVAPVEVPTRGRRAWALDAAALGLGVPGIAVALVGLIETTGVPGGRSAIESAATLVPALAEILTARQFALGVAVAIVVYLHLKSILRRDRWVLLATIPLVSLLPLSAPTGTDAESAAIAAGVGLVLGAAVVRWLLRANLAAYFLAALLFGTLSGAMALIHTADGWLVGNGIVLALLSLLAPVVVAWWGRSQNDARVAPGPVRPAEGAPL
jgi:hypothetical protein